LEEKALPFFGIIKSISMVYEGEKSRITPSIFIEKYAVKPRGKRDEVEYSSSLHLLQNAAILCIVAIENEVMGWGGAIACNHCVGLCQYPA
jgi:hypothetical protein